MIVKRIVNNALHVQQTSVEIINEFLKKNYFSNNFMIKLFFQMILFTRLNGIKNCSKLHPEKGCPCVPEYCNCKRVTIFNNRRRKGIKRIHWQGKKRKKRKKERRLPRTLLLQWKGKET